MDKLTISIFGNQIFSEIINEIKLFSKFKLKFYDNLDLCTKDAVNHDQLVILFITEANKQYYKKIENNFKNNLFNNYFFLYNSIFTDIKNRIIVCSFSCSA